MSELSEIFHRLNAIDNKLSYLTGQYDADKEHRVTKNDLSDTMRTHLSDSHNGSSSPGLSTKAIIAICTAFGGGTALLIELIKFIKI